MDFGGLRRLQPISTEFGLDRGTPVDRWYIERFVASHAKDISGQVMEIGDTRYVDRFGRAVSEVAVLDLNPNNARATLVADLGGSETLPRGMFDCIICTQTLHYVYDLQAALARLRTMLRPGGVLLLTLPGISQVCFDGPDHWRLTARGLSRLLGEVLPSDQVQIEAHGNVLSSISFLHGVAAEELEPRELAYRDPAYDLLLTARVVRSQE